MRLLSGDIAECERQTVTAALESGLSFAGCHIAVIELFKSDHGNDSVAVEIRESEDICKKLVFRIVALEGVAEIDPLETGFGNFQLETLELIEVDDTFDDRITLRNGLEIAVLAADRNSPCGQVLVNFFRIQGQFFCEEIRHHATLFL